MLYIYSIVVECSEVDLVWFATKLVTCVWFSCSCCCG